MNALLKTNTGKLLSELSTKELAHLIKSTWDPRKKFIIIGILMERNQQLDNKIAQLEEKKQKQTNQH